MMMKSTDSMPILNVSAVINDNNSNKYKPFKSFQSYNKVDRKEINRTLMEIEHAINDSSCEDSDAI